MEKQDLLHALIRSMSKSEKGFFNKYARLYALQENTAYKRLFDLIAKMEVYDEKAIEKFLSKEKLTDHFPFLKNYLKRVVLKTLRLYKDDSPNSVLSEMLCNAELLYKRKMYGLFERELARAKKHLYQFELYHRFSEIAFWQRQFLFNRGYSDEINARFELLNEEERINSERVLNNSRYHHLAYRISEITIKKGQVRDEETNDKMRAIVSDPLLSSPDKALTTSAKCFFFNINYICADIAGDHDRVYKYMKQNLECIEEKKSFLQNNEWRYVVEIYNFLVVTLSLNRYTEFRARLAGLKQFFSYTGNLSPLARSNAEILIANVELRYHQRRGDFEKIKTEHAQGAYGFLADLEIRQHPHVLVENYLMLAYTFVALGEYKTALKWNNILMNAKVEDIRIDIFSQARLLNLIIHYELGNEVLVIYNMRSAFNYLEKQNTLKEFETLVTEFIRLLLVMKKKDSHRAKMAELVRRAAALRTDVFEKHAFYTIDLLPWMQAKINKGDFIEEHTRLCAQLERCA